jgi:hypothetical protein
MPKPCPQIYLWGSRTLGKHVDETTFMKYFYFDKNINGLFLSIVYRKTPHWTCWYAGHA